MAESAAKKKWQQFEDLATDIQRELSPEATVTAQDKIRGKKSGAIRKVDISIRQRVGQYDILVIIDCKDYKGPVDVADVEGFIGMVRDVGANKGALVAANGFTKAAKTLAAEAGLGLHRLVDAGEHDWRSYVGIPVLMHLQRLRIDVNLQFLTGDGPPDPTGTVYSQGGDDLGDVDDLVRERVREVLKAKPGGVYDGIAIFDRPIRVKRSGRLEDAVITADARLGEQESFLGQLDATQFRGLTDEQTGKLVARAPLMSMKVPEGDVIRKTWQRVDQAKLATRPEIEIEMFA